MATSFYSLKNNAKSTITNNPLSAGGLSITLASSTGSRFPTTGNTWMATIWDATTYPDPADDPNMEVVLIDSRSTDTLTVNASGRGFAGTTGVEHATGSAIRLLVMKEHVDQITTAIGTLEGASVGTYTAWTDWTPTFGGALSANPTLTYARYSQVGKTVTASWAGATNGTMNGSGGTFTMTLPVAAKYAQSFIFLTGFYSAQFTWFSATVPAGSTTMTIGQRSITGNNFTTTIPTPLGAGLTAGWGDSGNLSNTITYEVA